MSEKGPARPIIVLVSSSSKKAGKSKTASYLVSELGAGYGLKVSAGDHAPSALVTDPAIISRPGTDTASLLAAGAKVVLWVDASGKERAKALERALAIIPPGGLLVIEGNCALENVRPDFAVFLMTVLPNCFKPSAAAAIRAADLVIIDKRWSLACEDEGVLREEARRMARLAEVVVCRDEDEFTRAMERAARLARSRLDSLRR